jgi:hypothetical protein
MSEEMIVVASGYGHNSREPFVEVEFRDERVQIAPEEAQEIARHLLESAEAALTDAFLVEFLNEREIGDEYAAAMLGQFRIWRGNRRDNRKRES